jgi:glycerophosphoryl diester phosphodiesterase/endonuclease/exonuclease/phosphatase family metal-dependent hydrolase
LDRVLVATLNILNLADRWEERLPLLLADMAALQPDLIGLQEVVYPMQQDRLLGAAGEGRYEAVRGWAGRPEYGNSMLVKAPLVAGDVDRLDLGTTRAAHRVRITLPGGARLVFAVAHLHNMPDERDVGLAQVNALTAWLGASPEHDAIIVVGDFNAGPRHRVYAEMVEAGFTSAHMAAKGAEPLLTWPSGLQAPAMDTNGNPECLDYIWVRGAVTVDDARLTFNRPAAGDPALYPSDHFGIAAHVRVGVDDEFQGRAPAYAVTTAERLLPATQAHPMRLAHRGDWRVAPENTLAALQAAVRIPACDGVEFDVRLSADGVPVLIHDETLARVQERADRVDALSAEQLGELGVPTLAASLAAMPKRAFLNVELKGNEHGDTTADVLRAARGDNGERAVISSFQPSTLADMALRLPGWKRWLTTWTLAPATIDFAIELGLQGLSVHWGAVTPATIGPARAAGLEVMAWTVRRRTTFDRLASQGVFACCVEGTALDG